MNKLIEVAKKYQRINQYSYVDTTLNRTVLRKPDEVEGEIEYDGLLPLPKAFSFGLGRVRL